jgi:hypothetical protein
MMRFLLVAAAMFCTALGDAQPASAPAAASQPIRVLIEKTPADEKHERERERKSDEHEAKDLLAQERSADAAKTQAWIGGATLAVSCIGAIFLFLTWRDARRTVKATEASAVAAQESARIAQSSLGLSQRPWLQVEFNLPGPVTVSDGMLGIPVRFTITNVGNTPALNVRPFAMVFLLDSTNAEMGRTEIKKLIAREEKAPDDHHGEPIFPAQQHDERTMTMFSVQWLSRNLDPSRCQILIVGGAYYHGAAERTIRQTLVPSRLDKVEGNSSNLEWDLTKDLHVPKSDLRYYGGLDRSYAD